MSFKRLRRILGVTKIYVAREAALRSETIASIERVPPTDLYHSEDVNLLVDYYSNVLRLPRHVIALCTVQGSFNKKSKRIVQFFRSQSRFA